MIKNILVSVFTLIVCTAVYSQDEKAKAFYKSKEYIKCVKRCNSVIAKDPQAYDAYFYKSISYYAMAIKKKQYEEFTKQPVDEFLKTIIALRKVEGGEDYFKEKESKFLKLKDYANRFADKKAKGRQESTAMRIYKLILKAYKPDYTQIDLIEVAFKVNDYYRAYSDIDRLYSTSPSNITTTSPKYKDVLEAPGLLVKYYMFQNSLQLTESYLPKFRNNKPVYDAMINGMKTGIDTLYNNNDTENFFKYSEFAMKMTDDQSIRSHYFKMSVKIMDNYRTAYDTAPEPKTWKDTAQLKKYFKFLDKSKRIAPFPEYDDLLGQMERKYKITIPDDKMKLFATSSTKALTEVRSQTNFCKDEEWINADPLIWSQDLYIAAEKFAKERFAYGKTDYGRDYDEHKDLDGNGPKERVDQTGLKAYKINTFSGVMFYGATDVSEAIASGLPMKSYDETNMTKQVKDALLHWLDWEKTAVDDCNTVSSYDYTHFAVSVYGDRWVLLVAKVYDIKE